MEIIRISIVSYTSFSHTSSIFRIGTGLMCSIYSSNHHNLLRSLNECQGGLLYLEWEDQTIPEPNIISQVREGNNATIK